MHKAYSVDWLTLMLTSTDPVEQVPADVQPTPFCLCSRPRPSEAPIALQEASSWAQLTLSPQLRPPGCPFPSDKLLADYSPSE